MGILDVVLSPQNAQLVSQMAKSAGIDESDVQNVIGQLLPGLSKGVKNNLNPETGAGVGQILNSLSQGNHQRYLDDPAAIAEPEAVNEGNEILSEIFGNKDVSRQLAAQTAEKTGVDSGLVKKLLPLLASTVMGALSQQTGNQAGLSSGLNNLDSALGGNDLGGLVSSFLDADDDGDVTDDLFNLAKKLF